MNPSVTDICQEFRDEKAVGLQSRYPDPFPTCVLDPFILTRVISFNGITLLNQTKTYNALRNREHLVRTLLEISKFVSS